MSRLNVYILYFSEVPQDLRSQKREVKFSNFTLHTVICSRTQVRWILKSAVALMVKFSILAHLHCSNLLSVTGKTCNFTSYFLLQLKHSPCLNASMISQTRWEINVSKTQSFCLGDINVTHLSVILDYFLRWRARSGSSFSHSTWHTIFHKVNKYMLAEVNLRIMDRIFSLEIQSQVSLKRSNAYLNRQKIRRPGYFLCNLHN